MQPAAAPPLSLRVLLFPGEAVLALEDVAPSTTLLQLRALLIARLPVGDGARIPGARIIFCGRMLGSDSAQSSLQQLGIPSGASLHVVMGGGSGGGGGGGGGRQQGADDDVALSVGSGAGARGFDRLQRLGIDEEGVGIIRSLFLPEVLSSMGPSMPREAGETESARLFRMEEAWMAEQGEGSDFAANIRPLLRQRGGGGGGGGGGGAPAYFAAPSRIAPWMMHPYVQQTMLQARAAGLRDEDVLRAGYTAAARVGLDPAAAAAAAAAAGGARDDGESGDEGASPRPGDARMNLGAVLFGVFVGSFLGWIAVFFLLNSSSNRWFKSGVMLGIFVNLMLLMLMPESSAEAAAKAGGEGGGGSGGGGGRAYDPNDSPWSHAVGGGPAPLTPP